MSIYVEMDFWWVPDDGRDVIKSLVAQLVKSLITTYQND